MPLALSVIFSCQLAYFRISSITNIPTHSYPCPNPNLNQPLLTMRIPNKAPSFLERLLLYVSLLSTSDMSRPHTDPWLAQGAWWSFNNFC